MSYGTMDLRCLEFGPAHALWKSILCHLSFPLMNIFNKTEAVIFLNACHLFLRDFLRTFPFTQIKYMQQAICWCFV